MGPKKEGRIGEAEKLAKKWKFDAQTFCVGGEEKDKGEKGTFCTVRAGGTFFSVIMWVRGPYQCIGGSMGRGEGTGDKHTPILACAKQTEKNYLVVSRLGIN